MPDTFDHGPPPAWEQVFAQAPLDFYRQQPRFRTEFCPVFYRGRLDGTARVLVIGQDPSTDEILAQRNLVGSAGQLVQGLLGKLGIVHSYAMFNTFLYGIRGQFDTTMRKLSADDPILAFRNTILDQAAAENQIEAIIAFGNGAHHTVDSWPGGQQLPVFKLVHPTARQGIVESWNQHLPQMQATIQPDAGAVASPALYGQALTEQDQVNIPRFDLPFGIPDWHGTGGTHSTRGGSTTKIVWTS
ncbi:MAG TPA: uracil-DNA glycosylase family protein [Herpetosiphonaceae bacterium]